MPVRNFKSVAAQRRQHGRKSGVLPFVQLAVHKTQMTVNARNTDVRKRGANGREACCGFGIAVKAETVETGVQL